MGGSGNDLEPDWLVAEGVVVVKGNYRLGPLGKSFSYILTLTTLLVKLFHWSLLFLSNNSAVDICFLTIITTTTLFIVTLSHSNAVFVQPFTSYITSLCWSL